MLESDDKWLKVFSRSDRLRPNTFFIRLNGTESIKSSVDDFDMELGIVRVRVGLSYDPLRLSPSSGDLYTNTNPRALNSASPPTPQAKQPTDNNLYQQKLTTETQSTDQYKK
jgi:hypothetical protein